MSPHNRYRATPPPPPVAGGGGQSALGVLGPLALKYGVNAALPGGGFAADAAMGLGSTLFNEGGAVSGGDRDRFVQSRWGEGATWRPTEGQAGVFDVMHGLSGTGEAKRTGQFTDFSVENMMKAARQAEAAGDTETANQIKSAVAQAAAPRPSPQTKGSYELHNIPLGQLLGADVSASGNYTERKGAPDDYGAGLKFKWKFADGGPVYKQGGGKAPLGGGQSKEGLVQARQLGALTQSEFLKAMAHAGYLQKGGKVKCGPLASVEYKQSGGEVSHHHKMSYHNPLAGGSSSKEK